MNQKKIEELVVGIHESTKNFASPMHWGKNLANEIQKLDSTSQQTIIGILVNAILCYAETEQDKCNLSAVNLCKDIKEVVGIAVVLPWLKN